MTFIQDTEFDIPVLMKLRDLGRTALAGRAGLRDHPLNNSDTYFRCYYILFDSGRFDFGQYPQNAVLCKQQEISPCNP